MSDADGLVAFLRARLDEEAAAVEVIREGGFQPPTWELRELGRSGAWYEVVQHDRLLDGTDVGVDPQEPVVLVRNGRAEHELIVRFHPARVLAEVEAKRRIVEDCSGDTPGSVYYLENPDVTDGLNCRVLCLLALPYADHPDYRPSWRP